MPVWVALAAITDWRWLRGRDDTPWYPSMRLFRQRSLGNWEDVFTRMAAEVERLISNQDSATIMAPIAPGELIDKLTILAIKAARIADAAKQAQVRVELAGLEAVRARSIPDSAEVAELAVALKSGERDTMEGGRRHTAVRAGGGLRMAVY